MSIFKAYDIRGVYPSEINEELIEKIGRAFADFIQGNKIAVGHDMRVSSPTLVEAFINGVRKQGKDVIAFGLTSTPMSYFACNYLKADGCAMITASHNPKEYNGVKMTREKAIPISGATGIKEIEKNVLEQKFKDIAEKGKLEETSVLSAYKEFVLSFKKDLKPMNIVVDVANGMGSQDVSVIKDDLPGKLTELYFEIDGTFPNHDANPLAKGSLDVLKETVVKEKADLGIALDGDADRVFFIDETGEMVDSGFITALIAEELLKAQPGSPILYDLRSSLVVEEEVEKLGGKPMICRVGHSFIKAEMREQDAVFAGELSGHFYFKDAYFTDSGIITVVHLLDLLSAKGKKLSELVEPMKRYFHTGEINSRVSDVQSKLKEIEDKYSDGKISHLDGIRIDFDDWWFNVRPSNTEPLLRLNLEAKSSDRMVEKRDEVLKLIRAG